MKKVNSIFSLSAIALALLGSSAVANAADLTANTNVTATVVEPAKLELTYEEGAPLVIKNGEIEQNAIVGVLDLSGYKAGTSTESVNFTDAAGEQGALTLTSADGKSHFTAKIETAENGNEPKVNGQALFDSFQAMTGENQKFNVLVRTAEDVTAGAYTDAVTVTVSNQ